MGKTQFDAGVANMYKCEWLLRSLTEGRKRKVELTSTVTNNELPTKERRIKNVVIPDRKRARLQIQSKAGEIQKKISGIENQTMQLKAGITEIKK